MAGDQLCGLLLLVGRAGSQLLHFGGRFRGGVQALS